MDGAWGGPGAWGPRGQWPAKQWRRAPVVVLPAVLAAVTLTATLADDRRRPGHLPLDVLGVALLLAGPAALLVRRRRPGAALVVAAVTAMAYFLLGYPPGPAFLAPLFALGEAAKTRRRLAWAVGVGGYAAFALAAVTIAREPRLATGSLVSVAAWTLVVLVVCEAGRVGRERAAEARRSHEEADRRRVTEERLRIARELHDVLAHHLSLISVRSGVALHLMDERAAAATPGPTGDGPAAAPDAAPGGGGEPEQVREALAAIKQASKDALVELRATLGVLRQVDEDAPRQPAPSLDRLDDLVAGARSAGVDVRTEVEGDPRALPPRVDLAGYRIVQEGLTNVSRHAEGATATVRVVYGRDALSVLVEDAGGTRPAAEPVPGGGNGIPGMRERVSALGGEFAAGPRPGGGFRVDARLPLDGAR